MNHLKTITICCLTSLLFAACTTTEHVPGQPEQPSVEEQLIQNQIDEVQEEWNRIRYKVDDLRSYRIFLYRYLDSRDFPGIEEFENKAKARIAQLEAKVDDEEERQPESIENMEEQAWDWARQTHTIPAYERFLRNFPDGQYRFQAEQARRQLIEKKDARHRDPLHDIMVFVGGGVFTRGCTTEQDEYCYEAEKPAHQVSVSDFYISRYPVTQRQWELVMGDNPSQNRQCGDCPVTNVSWNDAIVFIEKLNRISNMTYRLPTEAEWEYAARGGNLSRNYIYAGGNNPDHVAVYRDNSGNRIQRVGSKAPNELGLHDMSGLVNEWCYDYYGNYNPGISVSPTGPESGRTRVLRGGSWSASDRYCRVSSRTYNAPYRSDSSIGFRVAKSPNPDK